MFTYTETETLWTSGAVSEEHFVNMTTLPFQCTYVCLFDTAFWTLSKVILSMVLSFGCSVDGAAVG